MKTVLVLFILILAFSFSACIDTVENGQADASANAGSVANDTADSSSGTVGGPGVIAVGQANGVYCGPQPNTSKQIEIDGEGNVLPGVVADENGGLLWNETENTFTSYWCIGGECTEMYANPWIIYFPTDDCSGTGYVSMNYNYLPNSPITCQMVFTSMGKMWQTTGKSALNITIRSVGDYQSGCTPFTGPNFYKKIDEIVLYKGQFPMTVLGPISTEPEPPAN